MSARIHVTDAERRARLVARHHLNKTAESVADAARDVVALHSTDPATPYLAARARTSAFSTNDLDRALLEDRSLWRLHAMRRTLFVVPSEEGSIFEAGASRQVAGNERKRLVGWLTAGMEARRIPAFLTDLESRVLEVLSDGVERRTQDLTAAVPELGTQVTLGTGKWTTQTPISSRLLFLMAMDGRIVRTRAAGSWRSSQYHWAATETWFPERPEPTDPDTGRVEIARRYLAAHGPATIADLRWWTGWTTKEASAALAQLDIVMARLDDGGDALLLADDTDAVRAEDRVVALLPALDPAPMGWKQREWYLGSDGFRLFDRNGNIGPSVWMEGRIVGGWAQRPTGEVVHELFEDIGSEASRQVEDEAAALTEWLAGVVVIPRFRTPLERELSAP